MLNKDSVLFWNEIERDLYKEGRYTFGIILDLFNNHQYYYCKTDEGDREYYDDLGGDIYNAIEQFNKMISEG